MNEPPIREEGVRSLKWLMQIGKEMNAIFQGVRDAEASQTRWDQDYLALAKWWALRRSKDPSTKTGAVITAPDNSLVSLGYNGFARGVKDLPERYADRDLKYKLVEHCERNAIILARRDLRGCTLYTWPFMSCSVCSHAVIQAGIVRCVAPPLPAYLQERWSEDIELAKLQFREAGVQLDIVELRE